MNRSRGFTLIELLMVIAIIGLLSSVVLANLTSARAKAKYAANKQLDANFNHSLGDALTGQWLFEETGAADGASPSGAGSVKDSSGYGVHGTPTNAPTWSSDTPFGSGFSMKFVAASSQSIQTNNFGSIPSSVSVAVWVKSDPAGGMVVSERASSGWHVSHIEVETDGTVRFCVWTGGPTCTTASPIAYGTWQYLVLAYDNNKQRLTGYVNGVAVTTVSATKQWPTSNLYYTFGLSDSTNGGNGAYFSGLIDNVRVYERALDLAEIQKQYAEGLKGHNDIAFR